MFVKSLAVFCIFSRICVFCCLLF